MQYWYEKYPSLLYEEKKAFREFGEIFMHQRNKGAFLQAEETIVLLQPERVTNQPSPYRVRFFFDAEHHFCADVEFSILISKKTLMEIARGLGDKSLLALKTLSTMPESKPRNYKFRFVYEHNFPGRGTNNYAGGSIKAYCLKGITKPGFGHLLREHNHGLYLGQYYVCQVSQAKSELVNARKVLDRISARWILVYTFWEKTGIDLEHQCKGWDKGGK